MMGRRRGWVGWAVMVGRVVGLVHWTRRVRQSCSVQSRAAPPTTRSEEVLLEPKGIEKTANYREASRLSERIASLKGPASSDKKKVAIIGGGLSGLACGKYLSDAGHEAVVYEAREVLGGKTSAWQDEDGDWVETGLHVFFGAYPNMMRLLKELNIRDRLQWKAHRMSFALRERPGEFTNFDFPKDWPAPFGMAAAILGNTEMLSVGDKLRMVPGLLPMLLEGQEFIDAQDELSVLDFMRRYGMPEKVNREIFIAMAKALDFLDPEDMSMTVILTAMNRFIVEADGSQTAFLDGNQPDRLCAPLQRHIEASGGRVQTNSPVREIVLVDDDEDDADDTPNSSAAVAGLRLKDGTIVTADEYVCAAPVDVFKRLIPRPWSTLGFFRQLDELEGVPVINVQIWLKKKLHTSLDGLAFSRSPLLSVYADMSKSCREYASPNSVLSLVFAPIVVRESDDAKSINWLAKPDQDIVAATMDELARLFPEISPTDLAKAAVVRTPRSVYAAVPGRNKYRPSQETPIPNFVLAGCYTSQKFLGSMEGAVLAGKLAAEVVAARAASRPTAGVKPLAHPFRDTPFFEPRNPRIRSDDASLPETAIAFGGGVCLPDARRNSPVDNLSLLLDPP